MESMYKGSQAEEREGVEEKEWKKKHKVGFFPLMGCIKQRHKVKKKKIKFVVQQGDKKWI